MMMLLMIMNTDDHHHHLLLAMGFPFLVCRSVQRWFMLISPDTRLSTGSFSVMKMVTTMMMKIMKRTMIRMMKIMITMMKMKMMMAMMRSTMIRNITLVTGKTLTGSQPMNRKVPDREIWALQRPCCKIVILPKIKSKQAVQDPCSEVTGTGWGTRQEKRFKSERSVHP